MSKIEIPKVYFEACSITDMAESQARQLSDKEVERDVWTMQEALRMARDKKLRIFTSTISIAECTGADREQVISDKLKRFLEMLLLSGKSGVELVQTTQSITTAARDIRWISEIGGIRGADAIHLATARFTQCDELWTRDKPILKKRDALNELGILVLRPNETKLFSPQGQLPLTSS